MDSTALSDKEFTLQDCPVCLEASATDIVCVNKHLCCTSCHRLLLFQSCPVCRGALCVPTIEIPTVDLYTQAEIKVSSLHKIMQQFKIRNFIRDEHLNFYTVFADVLPYTTSAKQDKEYTLYRGLRNINMATFVNDMYVDSFPSSWSLHKPTAKKFGEVISTTVSSNSVLFDYTYVYGIDEEAEVVLVPGSYKYVSFDTRNLQLAMFTIIERNKLIEDRNVTICRLKDLCRKHKITGFSKYRRVELIDFISTVVGLPRPNDGN